MYQQEDDLNHSLLESTEMQNNSRPLRPRVTVLIAAYRAADFIEKSIATALDQDGVDVDVLVVDDHSEDDTAPVVLRIAAQDRRITLLQLTENGGPGGARNAGLQIADGDWIAILDADDAFLPGHLHHLVQLAMDTKADIVAGNFYFVDGNGDRLGVGLKDSKSSQILDTHSFLKGARPLSREADYGLLKPVFRKSFVRRANLHYRAEIRHGEDFHLIIDALQHGARYVVSREPSYLYTVRSSGKSRTRVDYKGMIEHTLALQQSIDDRRLQRLLTIRVQALTRLQTNRQLDLYLSSRQYSMILRIVFCAPGGWGWTNRLLRQAARKFLKLGHRS